MLFLANCTVIISYYMNDVETTIEANHIVEASTEEQAIDKIIVYYEAKDSSYSVTHYVTVNYCNQIII